METEIKEKEICPCLAISLLNLDLNKFIIMRYIAKPLDHISLKDPNDSKPLD